MFLRHALSTAEFMSLNGNLALTLEICREILPLKFIKKFAEKTILSEKGVTVRYKNDKLYIDLHISVMYGVNVSTIVKSIIHKVRFAVEDETGFTVDKVNVFVDAVKV